MDKLVATMIEVTPQPRQIEWQQLELTSFLHFGTNTFTDREWGEGTEDVCVFNPEVVDTDQWCESLLLAGIKACIITAKHHDGLCFWDTKFTDHCVANTPYKKDVVAQLSASCKKYGLKLGIYLSPWDRHEKTYGFGDGYNDYFCNQLTELLSNYGDIYTVWFDGACGEGTNGKKQIYDWNRFYEIIRRLQPNAVISVCGPDVRWCGNEAGSCRNAEWSVVPSYMCDNEKVHATSQQEDDAAFREKKLESTDEDLGSREILSDAHSLIWYPAEVDVSIRPGWFYHASEDDKLRPLEELKHMYLSSVGGNSVLLLNIPPNKQGVISEVDCTRLKELGDFISNTFETSVLEHGTVSSSSQCEDCSVSNVQTLDNSYWMPSKEVDSYEINMTLSHDEPVRYITIMEQIEKSQRIESYAIFVKNDQDWKQVYQGVTVGYKKICKLDTPVISREWKLVINQSRSCPTIKYLGMFTD